MRSAIFPTLIVLAGLVIYSIGSQQAEATETHNHLNHIETIMSQHTAICYVKTWCNLAVGTVVVTTCREPGEGSEAHKARHLARVAAEMLVNPENC